MLCWLDSVGKYGCVGVNVCCGVFSGEERHDSIPAPTTYADACHRRDVFRAALPTRFYFHGIGRLRCLEDFTNCACADRAKEHNFHGREPHDFLLPITSFVLLTSYYARPHPFHVSCD